MERVLIGAGDALIRVGKFAIGAFLIVSIAVLLSLLLPGPLSAIGNFLVVSIGGAGALFAVVFLTVGFLGGLLIF